MRSEAELRFAIRACRPASGASEDVACTMLAAGLALKWMAGESNEFGEMIDEIKHGMEEMKKAENN